MNAKTSSNEKKTLNLSNCSDEYLAKLREEILASSSLVWRALTDWAIDTNSFSKQNIIFLKDFCHQLSANNYLTDVEIFSGNELLIQACVLGFKYGHTDEFGKGIYRPEHGPDLFLK